MLKKQKESKKEIHDVSFQEWLPIEKICKNKVVLKNNKSVIMLKVEPINFKLKSRLEQNAIINQYKLFLKNLNSKIQIVILSKKTDISYHLEEIIKSTNENSKIKEMSDDYIMLLKSLVQEKGAITKEFYIVIEVNSNIDNEIQKIKEYLQNCENEVTVCDENEAIIAMRNFVSKRICFLV